MTVSPGRWYLTPQYTVLQDPSDLTTASCRVQQQGERRPGARVTRALCLCIANVTPPLPWRFKRLLQDAPLAKDNAKKRPWDTRVIEMSECGSLSPPKSLSKYINQIIATFAMNKSCLNTSQIFNYCHPQQPFLEGPLHTTTTKTYIKGSFVPHRERGDSMNGTVKAII